MKKTITKPDGTKEVVEGTAEEIAQYERQVRQEPVREETRKPGLLTDDVKKLEGGLFGGLDWEKILEEARKQQQAKPPENQFWLGCHNPANLFCEISVANRGGWLCVIPPRCTCNGSITITTTSYACTKCGKPTMGLNSSDLCNCANVLTMMREDPSDWIDWTKYRFNDNCSFGYNYIVQDGFGKRF